MKYGIRQLRRAWLGPADVLNTLEPSSFWPPSGRNVT